MNLPPEAADDRQDEYHLELTPLGRTHAVFRLQSDDAENAELAVVHHHFSCLGDDAAERLVNSESDATRALSLGTEWPEIPLRAGARRPHEPLQNPELARKRKEFSGAAQNAVK